MALGSCDIVLISLEIKGHLIIIIIIIIIIFMITVQKKALSMKCNQNLEKK